MKKIFLFLMGCVLMMAIGMNSCSSSDDNMENSKEDIELILSNIDKNTTYPVSDAVCWTDGLTSNYKSPSFYCLINDAPGLTSLYIHYKYYNKLENRTISSSKTSRLATSWILTISWQNYSTR